MLKGEKVILRPMNRSYLDKYHEYLNDVELLLLSSDEPPMPMEMDRLAANFERHIAGPRGEVLWFAIEVQGGKFIGQCLLHHIDQTARTAELGITIGDRDHMGRGYGRDAVSLLVKYAFRLLNLRKVYLTTNGTNVRAQKAFAAAGFEEEGRLRNHIWLDGRYDDLVYMAAFREDARPELPSDEAAAEPDQEPQPNAEDEA